MSFILKLFWLHVELRGLGNTTWQAREALKCSTSPAWLKKKKKRNIKEQIRIGGWKEGSSKNGLVRVKRGKENFKSVFCFCFCYLRNMYIFDSILFCTVPPSLWATLLPGRPSCSYLSGQLLQGPQGYPSHLQTSSDIPRSQSTFPPRYSFPVAFWHFILLIIHQNRYGFLAVK